jgi:hypothetical protein
VDRVVLSKKEGTSVNKYVEIFMKKLMVTNDEILIWYGRSVQILNYLSLDQC